MTAIRRFTTRRRDGDARAPGALERLLRARQNSRRAVAGRLETARRWPAAVATAEQVHGARLVYVPALRRPRKFAGVDGLLTDQPNQPLALFTADCFPIFIADRSRRIVGLLHAGWRGTRAGILSKAVRWIRRRWGIPARTLDVWLGPGICPGCFEVQWDVARRFPRSRRRQGGGWRINLAAELRLQARRLGVRFFRTEDAASCTMHGRRFYSYRRDRTDKRMASVMMRKG